MRHSGPPYASVAPTVLPTRLLEMLILAATAALFLTYFLTKSSLIRHSVYLRDPLSLMGARP